MCENMKVEMNNLDYYFVYVKGRISTGLELASNINIHKEHSSGSLKSGAE